MINLRSLFSITGINPRAIWSLRHFPKFFMQMLTWAYRGGKIDKIFTQLTDYSDAAGSMRGHYFHQDLIVSQYIYKNNPKSHLDIGSRVDGFVAHVAAFRKIKIIDIRPLEKSQHPNIDFIRADLMDPASIEPADSVSCLHALEHFGLGRYGDPIDPQGHIKGLKNISKLVNLHGMLYLSFPVSGKARVEFNAHRVINPEEFFNLTKLLDTFEIKNFDLIDDQGVVKRQHCFKNLADVHYGCGIFSLMKIN